MKKLLLVVSLLLLLSDAGHAVEDPSTYTVGGTDSADITTSSTRSTADDPDFKNDGDAYAYKDYTADHFGEFDIEFDTRTNTQNSASRFGILALSNTPASTMVELDTANDGLIVLFQRDGSDGYLMYEEENGVASSVVSGSAFENRYHKLTRVGTTCTLNVYTDSGRTTHASGSPISVTCPTTKYRYMYLILSHGGGIPNQTSAGYVQNVDIIQADSGGGGGGGPVAGGFMYVR